MWEQLEPVDEGSDYRIATSDLDSGVGLFVGVMLEQPRRFYSKIFGGSTLVPLEYPQLLYLPGPLYGAHILHQPADHANSFRVVWLFEHILWFDGNLVWPGPFCCPVGGEALHEAAEVFLGEAGACP